MRGLFGTLATLAAPSQEWRNDDQTDVDQVEGSHRAHVDQEVLRLEADRLEVIVDGVSGLESELLMDYVPEVVEVEGSDFHHVPKEYAGVRRHLDLEEGQHHEHLLRINHCPELVQRG